MKKLTFVLLMVVNIASAQFLSLDLDAGTKKVESIVYKKDGTQVKGTLFLKTLIPDEKKIGIRGDKTFKIKNTDIDSIQVFDEENKPIKGVFVWTNSTNIYNAKKGVASPLSTNLWAIRLIKGEVSLFIASNLFRLNKGKIDPLMGKQFIVKRKNEEAYNIMYITESGAINGNSHYTKYFKSYAPVYFSDNKLLVSKIEKEEYKKEDLETIVLEYNNAKNKKVWSKKK